MKFLLLFIQTKFTPGKHHSTSHNHTNFNNQPTPNLDKITEKSLVR